MLINSVILVLREVLEAAMLLSVLLALSRSLHVSQRWLSVAIPAALLSVALYAYKLEVMTDALDGVGQEVTNASLQLFAFACMVATVALAERMQRGGATALVVALLMAVASVAALTREASEILIYVSGFAASEEYRTAVYAGSAIGAAIGISLGVLVYAALRVMPVRTGFAACYLLLALIGAGMVLQATRLLDQADWLDPGQPLWDSNVLINEESLPGQLLFAVFGYEATPGELQAGLYGLSLVLMILAISLGRFWPVGRPHD